MTETTPTEAGDHPEISEDRQPVPSSPDEGYDQDSDEEQELEGPARSVDVP